MMETNFKKGGQRHVNMLNLWGRFSNNKRKLKWKTCLYEKKERKKKEGSEKRKSFIFISIERTGFCVRIILTYFCVSVQQKGLIFKKTVKTGEYPRQKSLIKYSTKLKTTLKRNENEKHFHFFLFLSPWPRYWSSFETSSICVDLSSISFCCNVEYNSNRRSILIQLCILMTKSKCIQKRPKKTVEVNFITLYVDAWNGWSTVAKDLPIYICWSVTYS